MKIEDKARNNQIVNEIIRQLGGNRFKAMTGAKNFCQSPNTLTFHLTGSPKRIKAVSIELNEMDLYDVKFITWTKNTEIKIPATVCNVYAEDLQRIFTLHTGLDTYL